jgi:hypothetical protein
MKEELRSILPEVRERKLTISWEGESLPPAPGEYMVSVGKKRKVLKVWQVVSFRKINSPVPNRWAFTVLVCPDLLKKAHVDFRFRAFVDGLPATTLFPHIKKSK